MPTLQETQKVTLQEQKLVVGISDLILMDYSFNDRGFNYKIKNVGTGPAKKFNTRWQWLNKSGNPVGRPAYTRQTTSLNAGESLENPGLSQKSIQRFLKKPPKTAVKIRIEVDWTNEALESNKENNNLILPKPSKSSVKQ